MGIRDVIPGAPTERKPVEVVDVGGSAVPFLRPLDWVATALRSFRERPLPGTYSTEAQPTFDLFGTAQLPDYAVEVVQGALGGLEVFGTRIPAAKWRQYLSVAVSHDDGAASHIMTFVRNLQDNLLGFPNLQFETSIALPAAEFLTARNVSLPPDGRIGAEVVAMGAGARMTLRSVFLELDIGEPTGGIT